VQVMENNKICSLQMELSMLLVILSSIWLVCVGFLFLVLVCPVLFLLFLLISVRQIMLLVCIK